MGPLARSVVLGALAAGALSAAARPALAADFEVTGDSAFQGYEVRSPWGDTILDRRRFLQTIGLAVYNLQGSYHPGQPDYRIVLSVRMDADFGINANLPSSQSGGETTYHTPIGNGVRYVPGLEIAPIDLMYGYVEGKNLAGGLLGFKLGRQYVTDVLGWWAFDGGLARVTTPYFVAIDAYAGLEERGGLPLSSSRFEQQGIWRGSHVGFNGGANTPSSTDYPSYQPATAAPAFGAALESTGPNWVHARLSYRRVFNTGDSITTQFPEPNGAGFHQVSGLRVSQDRIGAAGDINKPDLGALKGGFTYDLYNQLVASYFASAEAYLGKHVTLGADADYFVPTFDADSIWNWFTHGPMQTLTARLALKITKSFNVTASGGARLFWTQGDPTPTPSGLSVFGAGQCAQVSNALPKPLNCSIGHASYDPTQPISGTNGISPAFAQQDANRPTETTVDAVANLNARYRFASGDLALKGMLETGVRGSREGGDVSGEKRWEGGRYTTAARVSVYGWADPTRPDRDAASFAYVLAGGFKPAEVANMRVEWEHDMNRLVGQRYRVMGVLNLRVLR